MALGAILLLSTWFLWLTLAKVPVLASSREARLVSERAVYALEAPISARVASVSATLDRKVEAGEALFQLDDSAVRLAQAAEIARAGSLERRIESSRRILAARGRAHADASEVAIKTLEEARIQRRSLELDERLAQEELERLERLRDSSVSELQISKARTGLEKAGVSIQAQDAAIRRIETEITRAESDREAEIESLRRDLERDEGELASARSTAAQQALEIERHCVRAPAAGVVAEIATLAPGAFVSQGTRLATVVAPGRVVVEAQFAPADALGRVREGQQAEMALEGFPRLQFGSVPLVVERVASEARGGTIQVELALVDLALGSVPLEHGLPGRVRVEVERASPAALLLRSVGGDHHEVPTRGDG
jgi:membrane fusion protein (multidrug efflux system)